jgi:hypothetical protein
MPVVGDGSEGLVDTKRCSAVQCQVAAGGCAWSVLEPWNSPGDTAGYTRYTRYAVTAYAGRLVMTAGSIQCMQVFCAS